MKKKAKVNKSRGDTFAMPASPSPARKSVEIKRASNGFVVSQYHDGKDSLYIAKTHKEAQDYANKLLKM